MFHAFLRNIFGILLLFLVLVPDVSSPCKMDAVRLHYDNVLMPLIRNLNNMLQNISPCNFTEEDMTRQTAAGYRCSCKSNKEKALRCMARELKNMSWISCTSTMQELKSKMKVISETTVGILQQECTNTTASRAQKRKSCTNCCCKMFDPICCTKAVISDLRSCWMQFIR